MWYMIYLSLGFPDSKLSKKSPPRMFEHPIKLGATDADTNVSPPKLAGTEKGYTGSRVF